MQTEYIFPFGRRVKPCIPDITASRPIFILGAYPSALHIRWTPPEPFKPIRAIAVDNEPEIFWNGNREFEYVDDWMIYTRYEPKWGTVALAKELNGSSGRWVNEQVIDVFRVTRKDVWLSDCLDRYRCSDRLKNRIDDTYSKLPKKLGLPKASLLPHPSEDEIVKEAIQKHRTRLLDEIANARPDKIITLGNAALRVLSQIVDTNSDVPRKLVANVNLYGKSIMVHTASGHVAQWYPLAHPAAPKIYQAAHSMWKQEMLMK